jgi:hypothetical protein
MNNVFEIIQKKMSVARGWNEMIETIKKKHLLNKVTYWI